MLTNYGKLKTEISEVRREAADHLNRLSLTDDACVISKSYMEPKSFIDPDISVASSPRGQPNYYYGKSVMIEDNALKSVHLESTVHDTSLFLKANSINEGSAIDRTAGESRRRSETTETAGESRWDTSKPMSPELKQRLEQQ
jgi:hypothetical protein